MARNDEGLTVKDYVDALLRERDKLHDQRERSMEKGIDAALVSIDRRLGLLNELREGVASKDQIEALLVRFEEIKTTVDSIVSGSKAQWKIWATIVAAVTIAGVLFGIAGFILAHTGAKP